MLVHIEQSLAKGPSVQKLPTWVDVDLDAFVENLRAIRKSLAKDVAILLTVKADDDSKTYGETKTYGSGQTAFTSGGLQNGETIGTVTRSEVRRSGN